MHRQWWAVCGASQLARRAARRTASGDVRGSGDGRGDDVQCGIGSERDRAGIPSGDRQTIRARSSILAAGGSSCGDRPATPRPGERPNGKIRRRVARAGGIQVGGARHLPMSKIATEVLRPFGSGVHGTIFVPVDAPHTMPALVIGGSGGNEPTYIAELLAHHGIPAMSLAYFGHEGLPPELARIDIAYFQLAIAVLRSRLGSQRLPVALVGQSRDSEAAMLTALYKGDDIAAVVVSVPSNVTLCGFPSGGPAWLLDGKALPYADEFGPECSNPEAVLAVEMVPAPILFVSAGEDEVWPSAPMAQAMAKRRGLHARDARDMLLEYPEATHALGYLCPDLPAGLVRSEPMSTRAARAEVWPRAVQFLRWPNADT